MPLGFNGVSFAGPYSTYYMFQDDAGGNSARVGDSMRAIAANPNSTATLYSAFCSHQNLIYQCAGFDGTSDVTTFNSYDPKSNKWTSLATANGRELTGFQAVDGKIYQFGGTFSNVTTSSTRMDIYDIATNVWSTGTAVPIVNGNGAFGSCVYKRSIFMIGGFTQTGAISNATTYRYDIDSNNWTQLANIPNANGLSYAAALTYGDFIYLAGGKDGSSGNAVSTLYRYNIKTNVWVTLTPMPVARFGQNAVILNNRLYCLGGNTTVAVSSVIYYSFSNDSWTTDPVSLTSTSGNNGYGGVIACEPVGIGGA